MPVNMSNFAPIGGQASRSMAPQGYSYKTSIDTIAQVLSVGYFNPAKTKLEKKDFIICMCADGDLIVKITLVPLNSDVESEDMLSPEKDEFWQREGTTISPRNEGDDLDMLNFDIKNVANIDLMGVNGSSTDITGAELEELSDGSDTALHIHDSRYYTESEVDTFLLTKPDKVSPSTNNAIVRFDGITGDQQNSAVTIDDVGNINLQGNNIININNVLPELDGVSEIGSTTKRLKDAFFIDENGTQFRMLGIAGGQRILRDRTSLFSYDVSYSVSSSVLTFTVTDTSGLNVIAGVIGTKVLPNFSPTMSVNATAFVGTDLEPKDIYFYFINDGFDNLELTASNSDPEGVLDHASIAVKKFGSVSVSSVKTYAGYSSKDTSSEFIHNVYNRKVDEGTLYKSGLDVIATSSDLTIGTGIVKTIFTNVLTVLNQVSINGMFFVKSDLTYHESTAFDFDGEYSTGQAIGLNRYFNAVLSIVNENGSTRILGIPQNKPSATTEYISVAQAFSDSLNSLNIFPSDTLLKNLSVPVARVIVQRTGGGYVLQDLTAFGGDGFYINMRGTTVSGGGSSSTGLTEVSHDLTLTGLGTPAVPLTINLTNPNIWTGKQTFGEMETSEQFISTLAIGTSPFSIVSTTLVTNLNSDLLDGQEGSYYLDSANFTGTNWTDLTDAGDSSLHFHSTDRARANHTGTQTASTISDFDTEVSNNTDVSTNTTHRGSDGKDHSDVVLNNTHRTSNGTDHANVVLNDTHRGLTSGNPHQVSNFDVGLGTTSPVQFKSVIAKGGGTAEGFIRAVFGEDNNSYIELRQQANTSLMDFGSSVLAFNINSGVRNIDLRIFGTASSKTIFFDASSGFVSIGKTSPTQALDVLGNIAVSGTVDGVNVSSLASDVSTNTTAIGLNTTHRGLTNNPHSVDKNDVSLGNVDNTSDLDKPISTDTQDALDLKADDNAVVKLTGNQTIAGNKTFTGTIKQDSASSATITVDPASGNDGSFRFEQGGSFKGIFQYSNSSGALRIVNRSGGSTMAFQDVTKTYDFAVSGRTMIINSANQVGTSSSLFPHKMNIEPLEDVSFIHKLKPKKFNRRRWINEEHSDKPEPALEYGLIAEEVVEVNDDLGDYNYTCECNAHECECIDKEVCECGAHKCTCDTFIKTKLMGVRYESLNVALLKAVQDHKKLIDSLIKRIGDLEKN